MSRSGSSAPVLSPFERGLARHEREVVDLHGRCDARAGPVRAARVSAAEKARNARAARARLAALAELARASEASAEPQAVSEAELSELLQGWALTDLAAQPAAVRAFFGPASFQATHEFVEQARAFDPTLGLEALFQALRNVWIMIGIQAMFERPLRLTPSMFAYSLLYPYSDNVLDDARRTLASKTRFQRRFGRRLGGERLARPSAVETRIDALVGRIELEWPRARFAHVHAALAAIHAGQGASLSQQSARPPSVSRLVRLSVRKGGASVLADGYLVGGRLAPAQARFLYGYGVALQVLDDLQDAPEDLAAGHWTLASRALAVGELEALVPHLRAFVRALLERETGLVTPVFRDLRDLIVKNCDALFFHGVARVREHLGDALRRKLEAESPLAFQDLDEFLVEGRSLVRAFVG